MVAGLLAERDGAVLRLTIDRPDAANAITSDVREAMIVALEDAGTDLAVRAVLLAATGSRHFCTGADLRATRPAPVAGDVGATLRAGAQRLIAAVLDCPKPVVAAVNGTAAGLGANLALACDLVVAGESARFIQIFVRRGIVPDAGSAFLLPRLVGLAKAKELVLFGDDLAAAEALAVGLVNRVVSDGEVLAAASDWATRLAEGPTVALGLAKRLLNDSLQSDRATAFAAEADAQELASGSADFAEGLAAFAARRKPEFRGR